MNITAGLGSFDPNTLPMDAFELSGSAASIERYISLKAPWMFGQRKKLLDATTYTVEAGVTYILVTIPDAVTITIPEGLPLLRDLTIARSVASTNAITAVSSGSELIEGASSFVTHGAFVVSTMNNTEITLRKNSAADWRFVGGIVAGSESTGSYRKYPDRTMEQHCVQVLNAEAINTAAGSVYRSRIFGPVSFPKVFTTLRLVYWEAMYSTWAVWAVAAASSATPLSETPQFYLFSHATSASADSVCVCRALGSW